jgi:hypothetical protein
MYSMESAPASGATASSGSSAGLPADPGLVELFAGAKTQSGRTLLELLDEQPMMLFLLRPLGSLWTRETLAGAANALPALERRGVRPVFVHMASEERARAIFDRYALGGAERVADPACHLYTAPVFHLLKTTGVKEFLSPQAYWKLAKRSLIRHGIGRAGDEDTTQLPGIFFLKERAIYRAFRPKRISDRVDCARFGA